MSPPKSTTFESMGNETVSGAIEILQNFRQRAKEMKYGAYAKDWGFVFCRCTYTSQSQWDKFMSIIKEDARKRLENVEDQTLWEDLKWTVIEDPKLDGVDYVEAARLFGEWVKRDKARLNPMMNLTEGDLNGQTVEQFCASRITIPRHEFIIHASKESVESVLEAALVNDRIFDSRSCFVTVVSYYDVNLRVMRELAARDGRSEDWDLTQEMCNVYEQQWVEGLSYQEDDGNDDSYERCQNFKAWSLVELYAEMFTSRWPEFVMDDEGEGGMGYIR
jgi:hypothetical protein